MSSDELFALNAWLVEHAMGFKRVKTPTAIVSGTFFWNKGDVLIHYQRNELKAFAPTTDAAAAMMVLEKCIRKDHIEIDFDGESFFIMHARAETLPLAISIFAKKLFTSTTSSPPK